VKRPKHNSAPAKRARRELVRYFNWALPNGAHGRYKAALRGIVDDIIDAAVIAVRASRKGGRS
jgi:hypothetical protein